MLLVTSPEASLDGRGVSWIPPRTRWQVGASESQCGQWASAGVDVLSPVVHSRLRSRHPHPLSFALIILTNVHFSALVFLFR